MPVNWGLAAAEGPDYLQTLQALGQQQLQQQALQQRQYAFGQTRRQDAARPEAARLVAAGDYRGAQAVAVDAGDYDLAGKIGGLGESDRKRLGAESELLGRAAYALRRLPAEGRRAAFVAMLPRFRDGGFSGEELRGYADDLSDETLDGHIALSQSIKDQLGGELTQARIDDVGFDNARADTLATNTIANTQARLALARNADARGAAANARAAEARAEGRVRFRERDKDRAAIAAGGGRGGIPTNTDDLDY